MARLIACIVLVGAYLLGCDEVETYGPAFPSDFPLGAQIEFVVEDPGNAGIPRGGTIVYQFDAVPGSEGGEIVGTNPTTGQQYTPDSYTFQASVEGDPLPYSGVFELVYHGGLAEERYILLSSDSSVEHGTYNYTAWLQSGTFHASGRYRVVSRQPVAGPDPDEGTYQWTLMCASGAESDITIPRGACETQYKAYAAAFGCNEIADYHSTCVALYTCLARPTDLAYCENYRM